jgi:mannose-6-phosphate isomerase-like protein (cupin superfamily)
LALAVPLSRFTSQVGGGSAFFVRQKTPAFMSETFPEPILHLPVADIPIPGLSARISQSDGHQILFMCFSQDADIPEHSHESQWGVVLTGRIDLTIAGQLSRHQKGDQYFIPSGVKHSAKIYAGYSDVTFFDAPARYHSIL